MLSFIPVDFNPFAEDKEIEKIALTNEPQREIWLSCVIGGSDANLSYNESVSLKITGNVNFDAFKKSVNEVVHRHEALRATISPNGETLIIYKNLPVAFELEDLTSDPDAGKKFASFVQAEMTVPLDLKEGPLFRVFLHKTGEREYYFTMIKHHIIGDGWSTGIILEDLGKLYNAYVKGENIFLEPASQLSDYATAQADFKLTDEYKLTEKYWLDQYAGNVPVVDLPTDRPRFSPRSYKGNRIDSPLSKEMVAQLKTIGAKSGSSLVTTLLAAFEVFLYQQTRERDIVVGLPSSGQAASGLNNVVGHCVNLLPLKSYVDPDASFTDYLKKRKKEVLDAYDHQRLTFGELIKKLYMPRDPSRIPLVPVMFNIDMGMDNAVSFDGLSYKLISNPRPYENFELYLNATGSKDGILLEWSYNTDLFDAETIQSFHNKYYSILERIITEPATTISELAGDNVVDAVAVKEVAIAADKNICTLLADAAKQYADKTAVVFKNITLTYHQLNEKTDQLASLLIERGIGGGDVVAISIDRSIEMLVSLLAVLKAGAAYLPLDPEYPFERTQFMLEDSGAKLLITSKEYKGKFKATQELIIDEVWPTLGNYKQQPTKRAIEWSDLTYLLYTSGSTGKPKGVRITHGNMINFLISMKDKPGITDKDRLLAITSISFDIACLELYLPLTSGATMILADTETAKDGRLLIDMLEEQDISILQGTPSTWQMLLDSGWEKRRQLKMFTGGEQLSKILADKMLERGTELWNMYAPTETTIYSIIARITPQDKKIAIGLPVNNTSVYILDEKGNQVPTGHAGEIYIGGDGVADGYWNRPELTAERFVPNPYTKAADAKLYRTGDMGKVLDNGEILCMGRIDHQVKIRGHRIELGEIETAAAKQQGVKQAVVIASEDTPMNKRLLAYVTLNDKADDIGDPSWKDRWDTLYETGAENKQNEHGDGANIDGTLLGSLENSEELTRQKEEWLRTSIARIKELNAKKIYEIGSGAGQIMFELAPGIDSYIATDYAAAAIQNINERLAEEPQKWKHIKATVSAADDFSVIDNKPVDLVLINSVAQYFPNTEYMINVIRKAANALTEGGCLFIGDMQGMCSLEMYHAMDYYPRASDKTTLKQFNEVVKNRVRIEEEFVADPAFFYLLPALIPRISGVDVQLRKGQSINETTKYHYDIWLYVSVPVTVTESQQAMDWMEVQTIERLEALLMAHMGAVVEVKNITNARTAGDYKLLQVLHTGEWYAPYRHTQRSGAAAPGIHPDLFWMAGDKLNYKAHVRWTTDGTDGMFDVVFIPAANGIVLPANTITDLSQSIYEFARTPIINNEVHVPDELIQSWKAGLAEVLPAYMMPDDFIVLKKFPLTPNAKVDRMALPKPLPKREKKRQMYVLYLLLMSS